MNNENDKMFGLIFLGAIVIAIGICCYISNLNGKQMGRCAVVCDNISNVAVCESGLTVCKSGDVHWRREGQY
jgi:hypothetical protein